MQAIVFYIRSMIYQLGHYIYFTSLLFAGVYGVYRFHKLDTPARILVVLVCCDFINEIIAYYLAKKYHNNLPLYSIYSLIEFAFICVYFNETIDIFNKKKIGFYIGTIGVTLGVCNIIFFQPLNSLNSYFLLFEAILVIGMSLFAFFRLLLKEDTLQVFRYSHFWLTTILIFFWSSTFLYWGLIDYITLRLPQVVLKINFAELIVAILTYGSIGCIFLLYPKLNVDYEQ